MQLDSISANRVSQRLHKTSQMKSGKNNSKHNFIQIFKKLLNNLQREVSFFYIPELWNFLWFTLWNEQCNKTTRTFAFFLCFYKTTDVHCVSSFSFFPLPRVLCCLLLVVKRHVMTSLKQTISMSYFLSFVTWPHLLVDILASIRYTLLPDVIGSFC